MPRNASGQVPPGGVHPRILISSDQLPDPRRRLKGTEVGRALYATTQNRIGVALHDPQNWGSQLYDRLAAGDTAGAAALVEAHKDFPKGIGHCKPWLYGIVLEAFADVKLGTPSVPLNARVDSGRNPDYYVSWGPAGIDGDQPRITQVPDRAKFPVEIRVAAYPWGTASDAGFASATPVKQTPRLTR